MERPIWKGYIAFGLVNIPVTLYSAEKKFDLHFKLIDSRNQARVRYIRVNEETGEEVPCNEVIKGYEYDGNNYIFLNEKELKEISAEHSKVITIDNFIHKNSLNFIIFEKPYFLVPDKGGEKGYVILRDILKNTKKIGITKIILHTREYLAALMPFENAILLNLLRYTQEIRQSDEFVLPTQSHKAYKISGKEMQMAQQLVNSMTTKWNSNDYQDEFRLTLQKWLEEKTKSQKSQQKLTNKKKISTEKNINVMNFMSLLKKSLKEKPSYKKITRNR